MSLKQLLKRFSTISYVTLAFVLTNGVQVYGSNYDRPHEPLIHPAFRELPLGSVRPEGWLKDWCETARDGYVGHYDEYGPPFSTHLWTDKLGDDNKFEFGYEQSAYWIDGMTRLGYLLNDPFLIDKSTGYLKYVLDHQDAQGYLGWGKGGQTEQDWSRGATWPHWCLNVLSRAYIARYSATKDPAILAAMNRAYQNMTFTDFTDRRAPNVEAMLEFYSWGGQPYLKDNALTQLKAIEPKMLQSFMKGVDPILVDPTIVEPYRSSITSSHGVTYNEHAKLFGIGYLYNGNKDYLAASVGAYRMLRDEDMQPHGLHTAEEQPRGVGPLAGTETCDIADYLHSNGWMYEVIGQGAYGDSMEKAFFNAAPAAIARDFKSLQYFQFPNRIIGKSAIGSACRFVAITDPACCSGNSCRILPAYIMRMWMATQDNGLAATLYGPCTVNAIAGDGVPVQLRCATSYPFEEEIKITVAPERATSFPLYFRVPAWCRSPKVTVNGEAVPASADVNNFLKVSRTWKAGDSVSLTLPMKIQVQTAQTKSNGAKPFPDGGSSTPITAGLPYTTVERGPLLYALGLPETDDNHLGDAAQYNYALNFASSQDFTFSTAPMPAKWDWPLNAPVTITAKAVKFDWKPNTEGNLELPDSPIPANGKAVDTITLVPYGCTKFRVSMFPKTTAAEPPLLTSTKSSPVVTIQIKTGHGHSMPYPKMG